MENDTMIHACTGSQLQAVWNRHPVFPLASIIIIIDKNCVHVWMDVYLTYRLPEILSQDNHKMQTSLWCIWDPVNLINRDLRLVGTLSDTILEIVGFLYMGRLKFSILFIEKKYKAIMARFNFVENISVSFGLKR